MIKQLSRSVVEYAMTESKWSNKDESKYSNNDLYEVIEYSSLGKE
jgi:hypothetical protein